MKSEIETQPQPQIPGPRPMEERDAKPIRDKLLVPGWDPVQDTWGAGSSHPSLPYSPEGSRPFHTRPAPEISAVLFQSCQGEAGPSRMGKEPQEGRYWLSHAAFEGRAWSEPQIMRPQSPCASPGWKTQVPTGAKQVT